MDDRHLRENFFNKSLRNNLMLFGVPSVLDEPFYSILVVRVYDLRNEPLSRQDVANSFLELMRKPFGKVLEDVHRASIDLDGIGDVRQASRPFDLKRISNKVGEMFDQ